MVAKCARIFLQLVVWMCMVSGAHAGSYDDFFSAIEIDDGAGLSELLARGFDPNTRNAEGQVGLFIALQKDSYRAVDAIVKSKEVNINAQNAVGETPVMLAALKGNLEWTHKLLLRGAQVNKPGWTALHYAACSSQPKVVSLLLDNGALINAESPNRTTPLMMAARYGDEINVQLLVNRQADGRKTNEHGLDAAAFARLAGRDGLAKALEERFSK